jgi:hypothetical protein
MLSFMDRSFTLPVGLAMLVIAAAMIGLEWSRNRTNPPFPAYEGRRQFYWIAYLVLIVLGAAFTLSAIIR